MVAAGRRSARLHLLRHLRCRGVRRALKGLDVDLAAANWNTSLGAACFLACAIDTLRTGRASKAPLRREVRELEHELERDVQRLPQPWRSAGRSMQS